MTIGKKAGSTDLVAYSFKRRFVAPIQVGLGQIEHIPGSEYIPKRQTIRADRARHARPGEELQLYCGMRTKGCFLIGLARCVAVDTIYIAFRKRARRDWVRAPWLGLLDRPNQLDDFARRDGFNAWDELRAFWAEEHPGVADFRGVLIIWEPLR